jgi:hypothetical protein
MQDSNMAKEFWNKAVGMAAYVIYRDPSIILNDITPAEV